MENDSGMPPTGHTSGDQPVERKFTEEEKRRANELATQVIGAAIEVHRHLGPGLLESAYQACLAHELTLRGIPFREQQRLPIDYKELKVKTAYRMDFLVGDCLLVELKSVEKMQPLFMAQLLTYLRLSNHWLGLLINFNVIVLRDGIKRVVCG